MNCDEYIYICACVCLSACCFYRLSLIDSATRCAGWKHTLLFLKHETNREDSLHASRSKRALTTLKTTAIRGDGCISLVGMFVFLVLRPVDTGCTASMGRRERGREEEEGRQRERQQGP